MRVRQRAILWAAFVAAAYAQAGCKSDPIETDEPSAVVKQCCAEAQERIDTVKDVTSDEFRERCDACRRGEPKSDCAKASAKLYGSIKNAYGEFEMPGSCTRMTSQLAELGIE